MRSPGQAESSAQALERFIASQLASLSLAVPEDDVEYMARFVEEEGLDRDAKLEGLRGMLESFVSDVPPQDQKVDGHLATMIDEWTRLRSAAAVNQESPRIPSPPPDDPPVDLAAAQRAALLRQYAYLEGDSDVEGDDRDPTAPARTGKATAEAKKAADEKRRLIEEALKLDGKKKKYRKQQEVDLLAPNLNREKVAYRAQLEREAQKRDGQARKERDKAALEKQRSDAARAKAERQKKAAKRERRA
ncbi:hypothetical protein TREMEDRAFT_66851 [Tremella mesenterica DSM 1558]|uniref:uncharacterized protein n=1 Tax=Tremella mesenterica (strain ATCC 24925 / CBS 8224 / DSM 1558 / NBRC 9311 / NRRL Y-6157 / RJB 2259-6 / UBC 559-6) TaxID=578456 RepID=UPI0003F48C82|nr:uncharacterized protein TREMEDRAFT_66851 [Tremella mesenterica DSM 1558]EIW72370.1 hypothetical protein TREMEDRAFT_66851 [Tremella mesenterica DSM 1558]